MIRLFDHAFWQCSFVIIMFLGGISGVAQAANEAPPAPVVLAEAVEQRMSPTIMASGSVVSRFDASLAAEVQGTLVWLAEVGSRFEKGDVIARIDNTRLLLQRDEYQAEVDRAQARLKFLEQEVRRLTRLAKENNAAQTRLEQTEADRDVARGDLASSKARLQQVQDLVKRSEVKAPFPGTIVQRYLQIGEWADEGKALVRLVDTGSLEVRAMVPLNSLSFLSPGSEILLQEGQTTRIGLIRSVATAGDMESRLLDIRIDYTGSDWLAGQPVRVAVPTSAPRKVIAVPRDALVLRRSGAAVFRVSDEGVAERVEVATGIAQGELIEVIGDIHEGDKVVTRGGERLRPGQKVQDISAGPAK